MSDHEISTVENDTWKFRMHRSIGTTSKFFAHVEGTVKKSEKAIDAAKSSAPGLAPTSPEINALRPMAGEWRYTGWIVPFPGVPKTPITGTSHSKMILGGHAYFIEIKGDPIPGLEFGYHGHVYVVWDAQEKAYRSVGFENMGGASTALGTQVGERKIAYTGTHRYMGLPMTNRTIMEWSDDRKKQKITSDACISDQPCSTVFETNYVRVEKDSP